LAHNDGVECRAIRKAKVHARDETAGRVGGPWHVIRRTIHSARRFIARCADSSTLELSGSSGGDVVRAVAVDIFEPF